MHKKENLRECHNTEIPFWPLEGVSQRTFAGGKPRKPLAPSILKDYARFEKRNYIISFVIEPAKVQ